MERFLCFIRRFEGLINRAVTLIIGIIVLAIYVATVAWIIGKVLPFEVQWYWRLVIGLSTLWSIALIVQIWTYEKQMETCSLTSIGMMALGPIGTCMYFCEKLVTGEPLNRDRPGLDETDYFNIPLYSRKPTQK